MHIGLVIAIVVLGLVVVAGVLGARQRGQGFERIARCGRGHLFTSTVVPGASIKAIRLWNRRFQRCPVGGHWTLVEFVDPASLTPEEREAARSVHDARVP